MSKLSDYIQHVIELERPQSGARVFEAWSRARRTGKPHLFRQNGRWVCALAHNRFTTGQSPSSALRAACGRVDGG